MTYHHDDYWSLEIDPLRMQCRCDGCFCVFVRYLLLINQRDHNVDCIDKTWILRHKEALLSSETKFNRFLVQF